MRGPGNTPGAFAMEQAIDELAGKLGLDPLVLRERIDPSPVRREERRLGAQRIGWDRRHKPGADAGPVKRGLGVAQSLWGANVQSNAACEVRLLRDGSVEVLSSVQDLGTGIGTILAQVVAEEFGLRPEDITVHIGDTDFPAGPPSQWQPHDGLHHAARTHRGVEGEADAVPPGRASARRRARSVGGARRPHRGARRSGARHEPA